MKQKTSKSQTNTQEKKEKNFFKKHWKKIVVTTVVICGVTVSVILLYKSGNKITKLFEYKRSKTKVLLTSANSQQTQSKLEETQEIIEKIVESIANEKIQTVSLVKGHPLKLPNGKKATPAKQEIIRTNFPGYDTELYTYRKPHERNYNKIA